MYLANFLIVDVGSGTAGAGAIMVIMLETMRW